MRLEIKPVKCLRGIIRVPGDKSISHRAVMFGSLAQGVTEIDGFLAGEDCLSTLNCFQKLGVEIDRMGEDRLIVHGCGLRGLREPGDILDVRNSGTTMRLMLGILAGQPFYTVLTGDASLRKRPMGRVVDPLREMGAKIWGRNGGRLAPLSVYGGELRGIDYHTPVASAQVKSSILLAGLNAEGETRVTEPSRSRDHTERMLSYLGAKIDRQGTTVTITGSPSLQGKPISVPGDISSASYFLTAGAMLEGSELTIERVGINPTRAGILEVLREMSADLQIDNIEEISGEMVADITVKGSELHGVTIGGDIIPRLIDELPLLAVAGTRAEGEMIIKDASELRVKETDRIAAMVSELRKLSARVEEKPDGMIISGGGKLKGAIVNSYLDHRMAMSLAVAGLVAEGETIIEGAECIDVSFPGFMDMMRSVCEK